MKRIVPHLLFWCSCLAAVSSWAQPTVIPKEDLIHQWSSGGHWEISGLFGAVNYQGDFADDLIEFKETKPVGGLILRYHLNEYLALRGGLMSGQISGNDRNSPSRINRGWQFDAILTEFSVGGEFLILPRKRFNNAGVFVPHFSPFLYAGVALGFSRINLRGPSEDLPNYETFPLLGDTRRFVAVPFGGGLRLDFAEEWVVGAEIGFRNAFSDGLDGVATISPNSRNDWYLLLGGTLSYYLSRRRRHR